MAVFCCWFAYPINSGTNPSSWLAGVLVFLDNDKRGLSLYRVSSPDNEFYRER